MIKQLKKVLSVLLTVVMLIGCFSIGMMGFADEDPEYTHKLILDLEEKLYVLADANGNELSFEEDPIYSFDSCSLKAENGCEYRFISEDFLSDSVDIELGRFDILFQDKCFRCVNEKQARIAFMAMGYNESSGKILFFPFSEYYESTEDFPTSIAANLVGKNDLSDPETMALDFSKDYCVVEDVHFFGFYRKSDNTYTFNENPIDSTKTYNMILNEHDSNFFFMPYELDGEVTTSNSCFRDYEFIETANEIYWLVIVPLFDFIDLLKEYEVEEPFYNYYQTYIEEYRGDDDLVSAAENEFYDSIDQYDEIVNNVPDLIDILDTISMLVYDYDEYEALIDVPSLVDFFENYESAADLGMFALVYDENKIVLDYNGESVYVVCYSPVSKQVFLIAVSDNFIDLWNGNDDGNLNNFSFALYKLSDLCSNGHQLLAEVERVETPATCTDDGIKVIEAECQVCHKIIFIRNDVIPATGHLHTREETTILQEADCYHIEKKEVNTICEDCEEVIMTVNYIGAGVKHGEIETIDLSTPATCISQGFIRIEYCCKLCGQKIGGATQPMATPAHPVNPETGTADCYEKKVEETPATCTQDGQRITVVWCNECNIEVSRKTETLYSEGHQFGEYAETGRTEATCEKDGIVYYEAKCANCPEKLTKTQKINAFGHQYGAPVESKNVAPTCTKGGYIETTKTCERCQDTKVTRQDIAATGHYDNDNNGKCDDCGYDMNPTGIARVFQVFRTFFTRISSFFKNLFSR